MRKMFILYSMVLVGFLLGIHGGRIALWEDGNPEPVKVFPYSAQLLPRKDRQALEKGIHFDTQEELAQRIEDYLS